MEVDSAGVSAAILPNFVGEPSLSLCGRRIAPLDGALLETQLVAAGFRLDRAVALRCIEQLHSAEESHDVIPSLPKQPSLAVSRLRGVKDGERCGLAPKTVDFDW